MDLLEEDADLAGRTLEELEQIYNDPSPVKASLRKDRIVVQSDGHVSEKVQV